MDIDNTLFSRKSNNLINEKSPYLLQHAHNPVDWYPWGEKAFDKAKAENKPVFLSIGYSTCHWCHVMERESFEDTEVAQILNEHFISIKVDREERPDIDSIYMSVCQAFTGHGGWPLSIFITPNKKPFFAGTYFPKNNKYGRSGFIEILHQINNAWRNNQDKLISVSESILNNLNEINEITSDNSLSSDIFNDIYNTYKSIFDSVYGGFGSSPKFPTPQNIYFLLRYYKLTGEKHALYMAAKTLDCMHSGGIYDHIGFGFSRYSTDEKWLVPHFEKMLYDNALLSIAYLEAFQATKDRKYSRIAEEIFTYVLRDMTSPEGVFYSAEDADSEGIEGKFYVWSQEEIISVLGDKKGSDFCSLYNITKEGNFEGKNIPNLIGKPDEKLDTSIQNLLFKTRKQRIHPYKDDKILTSWNGLIIAALAVGARILNNNKYADSAANAVNFILRKLRRPDGRLLARYRDGDSSILAYSEDYAFLIWGLIELYQATFDAKYISTALELNSDLIKYFWDTDNGGLFLYGSDSEQLISRPKEIYDGALPSANSVAAQNWLRLYRITGNSEFESLADRLFKYFSPSISYSPSSHAFAVCSYMLSALPSTDIVIVGNLKEKSTQDMLTMINSSFNPNITLIVKPDNNNEISKISPAMQEHISINNKTTVYVCKNFACQQPVTSIDELQVLLNNEQ